MPEKQRELQFDVHPSVVLQLGAELTSDDLQALIELVKNCYDADATYASVTVNTVGECKEVLGESFFPDAKGYVVISDDGTGMDVDAIRQGWLVVSNSVKRRLKASGSFPQGSRVPLGDKGLGRLAAQRIAENVEVISSTEDASNEHHIGFSWSEFSKHELLSEVPILGPRTRQRQKGRPRHGTMLVLSGLISPSRWHGPIAKADLEDRFAELISPFESIDRFDLAVTIDGVKIDPARVARKVRNEADATFSLQFDGRQVRFAGKVKMGELEPSGDRKRVFNSLCEADSGERLLRISKRRRREGLFVFRALAGARGSFALSRAWNSAASISSSSCRWASQQVQGRSELKLILSTWAGNGNHRPSAMRRCTKSLSNHWRRFASIGMGSESGFRVIF